MSYQKNNTFVLRIQDGINFNRKGIEAVELCQRHNWLSMSMVSFIESLKIQFTIKEVMESPFLRKLFKYNDEAIIRYCNPELEEDLLYRDGSTFPLIDEQETYLQQNKFKYLNFVFRKFKDFKLTKINNSNNVQRYDVSCSLKPLLYLYDYPDQYIDTDNMYINIRKNTNNNCKLYKDESDGKIKGDINVFNESIYVAYECIDEFETIYKEKFESFIRNFYEPMEELEDNTNYYTLNEEDDIDGRILYTVENFHGHKYVIFYEENSSIKVKFSSGCEYRNLDLFINAISKKYIPSDFEYKEYMDIIYIICQKTNMDFYKIIKRESFIKVIKNNFSKIQVWIDKQSIDDLYLAKNIYWFESIRKMDNDESVIYLKSDYAETDTYYDLLLIKGNLAIPVPVIEEAAGIDITNTYYDFSYKYKEYENEEEEDN